MAKPKRKLTAEQRRAKRERNKNTMIVFVNGKQKRVPRPPTLDGIPVDQWIAQNADPIWLHQMGMGEYMPVEDSIPSSTDQPVSPREIYDDQIPF